VKGESVTPWQYASGIQFYMGSSNGASTYAWHKTQKECVCKGKIPGPPYIRLLQLWTMFSLASNAARKNKGTE